MSAPARLDLDHARAPATGARQAAALALLALAVAVIGALRWHDLDDAAQALEAQAARTGRQAAPGAVGARAGAAAQAELALAGEVRRALAVPWEQLFGALEACAAPDVTLFGLDAGPERRQVKLSGEARDLPALLDYLRRLGASAAFASADLQQHQVRQDDPQRPVRFVVVLGWRIP